MATRDERTGGRRCLATGCERRGRSGHALCTDHERGAYGRELEAAVGRMARRVGAAFAAADGDEGPGVQRRAAEFGRRLARGEYRGLLDDHLRTVMKQAAAKQGVLEEIGALRVVLARLLSAEHEDPLRLAHGVARVAGTAVRAVAAQRALEGEPDDEFQAALAHLVRELGDPAPADRRGDGGGAGGGSGMEPEAGGALLPVGAVGRAERWPGAGA